MKRILAAMSLILWAGIAFSAEGSKKMVGQKHGPAAANHDYHFKKKIDPGALQAELRAAGFSVNYIDCSLDNCTIHMPPSETKDPAPIVEKYVYVDRQAARAENLNAIQQLTAKFDAGQITPAEKDELLRRLIRHVMGQ